MKIVRRAKKMEKLCYVWDSKFKTQIDVAVNDYKGLLFISILRP